MSFSAEFYQTFKEDLIPITLQIIPQNRNRMHYYPIYSMKAQLLLTPKPRKDPTKKENFRPICLMNINTKILK